MIPVGAQPGFYQVDAMDPHDCYLEYRCPCGCGTYNALPIYRAGEAKPSSPSWEWDGSQTMPTLSPSIRHLDGCRFHGYIRAGEWSSAGDGAPVSAQVYRGSPSHPVRSHVMPDPTPPEASTAAEPPVLKPADPPLGSVKTHHLKFIDGILHQLHVLEEVGRDAVQTWVAIEGQTAPKK